MSNLIGQSLGRYHILERLGEGGMATVYKAYDTRLERDVAVKVLRTELFGQAVLERLQKRFEREAKALAKLSHPNIVEVYDYGEYEVQPYLVMKYLPGGTLKQRLGKPMPWQDALRLLLPVARALDYAHQHNILHRDVKPSNILLTEQGEPMLTDFGIAKILDLEDGQTLTATGVGVGTPEYMSPEQGLGKPVDARTDVYSLGVVLYEMVTGRKPFQADTPMAVVVKHLNDPLPRPTQFAPDLPEAVEKILLKALAKQPQDRYASMAEMAAAMEKLVVSHQSLVSSVQSSVSSRSPLPLGAPFGDDKGLGVRLDEAATVDQGVTGETVLQEEDRRPQTAERRPQTAVGRPPSEIRRPPSKLWLPLGLLILLLGAGAALGWGLVSLGMRGQSPPAGPATPTNTPTHTPNRTLTPIPTRTRAFMPTSTPTPILAGAEQIAEKDGAVMVYVPAGSFTMGNLPQIEIQACAYFWGDRECSYLNVGDEELHEVYLDGFWIDKTEVTNSMYVRCVEEGFCQPPSITSSHTRTNYFGNPRYANFPVINVSWYDAQNYCLWAGRRLPTEAEWEKAARGTDGRLYPWGNSRPTCQLANLGTNIFCVGDTVEVGSYPDGVSPFGALDMVGNVGEWVSDWYSDTYYTLSPRDNPTGPSSGQYKVERGFSFWRFVYPITASKRHYRPPDSISNDLGFRCARSP